MTTDGRRSDRGSGGPATRVRAPRRAALTRAAAGGALTAAVLSGCAPATPATGARASSSAPDAVSPSSTTAAKLTGEVTVLAAASLNPLMSDLAKGLERDNPGLEVTVSFGASSTLAQQVLKGAPADVIVTASAATMKTVTDAGDTIGRPVVVARNSLQIAVPPGNPAGITSLADLARPDVKVALCAPEVPCGAAAQQLLKLAGVTLTPDTYGRDVSAVVNLVRLGEVDAALVYRTDVISAGSAVKGVEVPQADQVTTDYPAAVVKDSADADAAKAVVDLLASAKGRAALAQAGFAAP